MLSAISADLPVYLVSPKARSDDQTERVEPGFGPDTRVEIRRAGGQAATQGGTEAGVYGPDGQFVEAASRRTVQQEAPEPRETTPPRDAPSRSERNQETPAAPETTRPSRDLALNQYDVSVPPADLEELRNLANRVERFSRARKSQDYERIEKLMDRVGRHDAAQRARIAAAEVQKAEQADEAVASLQASDRNEADASAN